MSDNEHFCSKCLSFSKPPANVPISRTSHVQADPTDMLELRQFVREFQMYLQDASLPELREYLLKLSEALREYGDSDEGPLITILAAAVEAELDARVNQTGWDEARRLVRRGAKATKNWLKTEDGQTVAGGAAVVAALLGINLLGE
ncbi:MAG: hypothetical protein ACOCVI_02460 [Planctomycetota bacterium]